MNTLSERESTVLQEIVINDAILYGIDHPTPWIGKYAWLTPALIEEIIALFPAETIMPRQRLVSYLKHFLTSFYEKQYFHKSAYVSKDRKSRAVVMRKELEKLQKLYTRKTPKNFQKRRELIK